MTENQTVDFTSRLSQVRSLPAISRFEIANKHEAARDLRMKNYLQWANFTQIIAAALHKDPLTFSLTQKVEQVKNNLNSPALADEFIRKISTERDLVQKALKMFRKKAGLGSSKGLREWDDSVRDKVGVEIFKSVTGKKPTGEVIAIESSIAVSILVRDESDFKELDDNTNIGGNYKYRQKIRMGWSTLEFPFLFLNGEMGASRHEQAHGINRAVINTLLEDASGGGDNLKNQYSFKFRWGGAKSWQLPENPIHGKDELETFMTTQVLPFSYNKAKNELLAEFADSGRLDYVENLKKRNGTYDFIRDIMERLEKDKLLSNFSPNELREITGKYWGIYTRTLDRQVKSMNEIINVYNKNGLFKRRDLFGYVLAQVPLLSWENIIARDFLLEAQYLQNNLDSADKLIGVLTEKINEITGMGAATESDFQKLLDFRRKRIKLRADVLNLQNWVEANPAETMFVDTKKLDEAFRSITF